MIYINDNQTEATINGVEYLLTPKEITVSKPETYTIGQLKSEKIAVRCDNWEQANRLAIAWGYPELWKEYVGQIHGFDVAFLEYPKWTSTPEYFVTDYGFTKTIPFSQVQFPEKRDWEVKSYKHINTGNIWNKVRDGVFEFMNQDLKESNMLLTEHYDIHSVLRSDGVEFTVVDEVEFTLMGDPVNGKIKSFDVLKDGTPQGIMRIVTESGDVAALSRLSKPSKPSKKALFKTDDGVEVFEGDNDIFWVDKKTFETDSDPIEWAEGFLNSHKGREQKYVIFKHRENALQYISDNKPEYSKRQILEAIKEAQTEIKGQGNGFITLIDKLGL